MIRRASLSVVLSALCASCGFAQSPPALPSASVWNALSSPVMDPAKSASTDNVEIVRDRVHITLASGTIQFAQPVNGVVFGAVFHGSGRVQLDPPNPQETQQIFLFTKQTKLDLSFTNATFAFTDGLLDEIAKQVKWQPSGPAGDDAYANRQKERESLGAAY